MDAIAERLRLALAGRYAVDRELGRGGMAHVFLAQDLRHERPVALKVLRPELSPSLGAERFLREIRLAATLQHPHILALFDSGEAAGLLYYVMPYVEGESLRARLNRESQLSVEEALKIASQVADALQYAHERDVVHRDIKPENILLSTGHALVADFGIARAIRAAGGLKLTETGLAVGTPAYMSPEQATGQEQVDGRADIYALGCLVYEMLSGAPPFSGPSAQAVMARHSVDPVPRLTTVRAVSADVEAVVLKALAKSPADRWASASAFAKALSEATPLVPPLRTRGHVRSPVRKRAGLVVSALAAAGVVWAVWPRKSPPLAAVGAYDSLSSVAVLPFVLIGDTTQAHIARGLTEAVITGLVKLEGVRVPAMSTIPANKTAGDPREVGRSLQVGMVLSSSLQLGTGKLRLTSRLINVRDGLTVWSEHFDGQLVDIFAMQDSITYNIVRALKPRLTRGEPTTLALRARTRDVEAYNLYMLGSYFHVKATPLSLRRAIAYYQQAIARDSTYADPLVGLAQTYLLIENVEPGTRLAPEPRPQVLLSRALELDSTHGGAHRVLGQYRWQACDTAGAEGAYRAAVRFEPGSAENRREYAIFLLSLGRRVEALAASRAAAALEPTSPWVLAVLAHTYTHVGRYDSAIAVALRGFDLDSTNWVANAVLGVAKTFAGDPGEGIQLLEASRRLGGEGHALTIGNLGWAYGRAGRRADAERIAGELARRVGRGEATRSQVAYVYSGLGDHETAFYWLAQPPLATDVKQADSFWEPMLDPLRSDPRFAPLASRRVCLKD